MAEAMNPVPVTPHSPSEGDHPASTALPVARARRGRIPPRHRLALWGSTLLCLGWLSHGWEVAGPGLATRSGELKAADYIQFYVMGSRIREGRADLLYNMQVIAAYAQRRI